MTQQKLCAAPSCAVLIIPERFHSECDEQRVCHGAAITQLAGTAVDVIEECHRGDRLLCCYTEPNGARWFGWVYRMSLRDPDHRAGVVPEAGQRSLL